jgi:hypothetical protein
MSAPVREPDQGPSKDEPLKYAPKKARLEAEVAATGLPPGPQPAAPVSVVPPGIASGPAPKGAAPESPEPPPWRRSRPRSGGSGTAFAGDVAVAELRSKLALAPDRLPEPPPPSTGGSKLVWAGRITGIAVVVAVGIMGYRWGSRLPQPLPSQPRQAAIDRSAPGTGQDSVVINAITTVYQPASKAGPPVGRTFRQLTVGAVPVLQADEPAPLAIAAADAGVNAAVVIGGLAAGSTLSAGREAGQNTWKIPVEELPGLSIIPPRGFIGSMDLTVDLRLADNSMADHKGLKVEWMGRSMPLRLQPRQHDAAEIAQIVKKGDELMTNGDVASARLMYQRAAEAGEAAAAFALAETYDPQVLAKKGIPPDVGLAQQWYAKARELGSTQASERLDRLAHPAE